MMRLLLAAAFIMTAAAGSVFAEGQYTTTTNNDGGVFITDNVTGAVRYCFVKFGQATPSGTTVKCSLWTK